MKIDELTQQTATLYLASVRKEKQAEGTETQGDGSKQPSADKVQLSSYIPVAMRSREYRESETSKVEDLKAQIAGGTYNVPASAVAEKMLSKGAFS